MQNCVTLFSNGIAERVRAVTVRKDAPATVTVVVRRDHLADVLASLGVFGAVTLADPPRYRAAPADGFRFDVRETLDELGEKLVGARVALRHGERTVEGTLAGRSTFDDSGGGAKFAVMSLVVLTADGLQRVPLREVAALRFLDADVRKLVENALEANLRSARPDTVPVTFTLSTDAEETTATVRYTLPAAAWKIAYRLERRDGAFRLAGSAVVDNVTDEDWDAVRLCVVTGEPITFSTDLAEAKIPRRAHRNVVSGQAARPVTPERSVDAYMRAAPAGEAVMLGAMPTDDGTLDGTDAESVDFLETAAFVAAEVTEADAFCVFEAAGPVTVAAGGSALVPLFDVAVGESDVVLHYDRTADAARPYRAVRFANAAGFSLAAGVCTVFDDGRFAGSCLLPACLPGEERLLPHALEPGVRVTAFPMQERTELVGLRIGAGSVVERRRSVVTMTYAIRTACDREFAFQLDERRGGSAGGASATVRDGDGPESSLKVERLKNAVRVNLTLPPRAAVTVCVTRELEPQSRYKSLLHGPSMKGEPTAWLRSLDLFTTGPLAAEPGLRRCFDLRERLAAAEKAAEELRADAERLTARQKRLRENLQAVGRDEQAARWRNELGAAEDRLMAIEDDSLPAAERAVTDLREELQAALKSLAVDWELA